MLRDLHRGCFRVPGQGQFPGAPQVRAAGLAEQPGHRRVQHIPGHDRPGRRRGSGRVPGQAAVHHAGDRHHRGIAPGLAGGGPDERGGLPGLRR